MGKEYYIFKRDASRAIDEFYQKGMDKAEIIWRISRRFGFGKKFVEEEIAKLEKYVKVEQLKVDDESAIPKHKHKITD